MLWKVKYVYSRSNVLDFNLYEIDKHFSSLFKDMFSMNFCSDNRKDCLDKDSKLETTV